MADASTFSRNVINTVGQLVSVLQQLQTISDRIASDSALAGQAATAAQAAGRADLSTGDFDRCKASIDQMLFTFNSGNPSQKQNFYKML